jgi:acetyltransferase-like isoleucine patch superfamily enzyme
VTRVGRILNRYQDSLPGASGLRATAQLGMKVAPMTVRGAALRWRLGEAGGAVFVGRGVRVRQPQFIRAQGRLLIEDFAELHGLSTGGLVFGDQVSIGTGALIRPSGYYSRDIGDGLELGDRSSIGPHCFLGCWGRISIGSDVMLAPGVRIFGDTHLMEETDRSIKSQGVRREPVSIGNDCWIASGVTIVGGVTIGNGVIVGAGSVVTRDLPDYVVAAGNPARIVRQRRAPS